MLDWVLNTPLVTNSYCLKELHVRFLQCVADLALLYVEKAQ